MKNRVFQNKGESMTERIDNIGELQEVVKTAKGYMLGITILTKEETLNHYLVSDNFPFLDMLKSLGRIKELVIKQLEEDPRAKL